MATEVLKKSLLNNCILYTTFEPTPSIFDLILSHQLQGLVYGAKDLKDGAFNGENPIDFNSQQKYPIKIVGSVLESESKSLIESFFRARTRESPNLTFLSNRGQS